MNPFSAPPEQASTPDLTLRHLLLTIFKSWKIFALSLFLSLACATTYLGISAKKHKVYFTAVPVETEQSGILSGLVQQSLSNYLPQIGNTKSQYLYFQTLLTSVVIADRLTQDNRIMQNLFYKEWNAEQQTWQPKTGIIPAIKRRVKRLFGFPAYTAPSAYRLSEVFKKEITLKHDTKKEMTIVHFKTSNPEFGRYLLRQIFLETDQYLKGQKIQQMQSGLSYIQNQIKKIAQVDLQQPLFNVAQSLQYQLVLLNTDTPFAAYLVDDITASDQPLFPAINKTLFLAVLFGILLGGGTVFLRILLGRKEFF